MNFGFFAGCGNGCTSILGACVLALLASGCGSESGVERGFGGAAGAGTGGSANGGGVGTGGANGGGQNGGGQNGGGQNGGNGGNTTPGGSPGVGGTTGGNGGFTASGGGPVDPSCNQSSIDPSVYPACSACNGGRCVPQAVFPTIPPENLAPCENGNVCIPDPLIATKGNVLLAQCSSVLGNEGRCTSLCLPVAQNLSAVLPQGSCTADERCAPCFNPNDGSSTGICEFGCDPGPTTQPILFTKCCGGRGDCIPRSNIPGNAKNNLAAETCTGADDPVCVPDDIVKNPAYRFAACTSNISVIPGTKGTDGGAGVCVPACIVNSTQFGKNINQGSCTNADDKCVPCKNPVSGQDSGACIQ